MIEMTLGQFYLLKNIVLGAGIISFILSFLLYCRFYKYNQIGKEIWIYIAFDNTEGEKGQIRRDLYFKMKEMIFLSTTAILFFAVFFFIVYFYLKIAFVC
ncbi:MAG: hypothetical protein WC435_01195 [Candidatus Paceibacterota bacterium]